MKIEIEIPDWLEKLNKSNIMFESDEEKMEFVINIVKKNIENGGGPFGAAIFDIKTGKIVSCGANIVLQNNLSILHAEIVAIMIAQNRFRNYSLSKIGQLELFSSSEPCAMCLGAILWSGLKRVVWGAPSKAAREIGFDEGPVFKSSWQYLKNKGIEIKSDLLGKKIENILRKYSFKRGIIYNP